MLQPSIDGSIQKDDGRAKPLVRPAEVASQLSKEKTGDDQKKSDDLASKSKPVQEEKPRPHRPTNFFERLPLSFIVDSADTIVKFFDLISYA